MALLFPKTNQSLVLLLAPRGLCHCTILGLLKLSALGDLKLGASLGSLGATSGERNACCTVPTLSVFMERTSQVLCHCAVQRVVRG